MALIDMCESEKRQEFDKSETINKRLYIFVAGFLLTLMATDEINSYLNFITLYQMSNLYSIIELTILVGLVYSYRSLTLLMQQHHPDRYLEIKQSMKYFLYVETVPFSYEVVYNFLLFLKSYK